MKLLRFAAVAVLSAAYLACNPFTAWAQSATEVQIPLGSWLEQAAVFIGPLLAGAVLWLIRKLPAQISAVLMTMRVDQLLQKAIDYAINATVNATKDKPLSVNVGNEVVAKAVQYAVDHGPGWLLSWLGGTEMLREKVIARLNVDAGTALK